MRALDRERLSEALALAESSFGLCEPNPRVGCIVGHEDGTVLGRGATQHAGGPHAEIVALRDAQASGHDLHGATAWVTLEPCAHHGRTPPCCEALVEAGVARVVVAVQDPYPKVAGAGIARLRAAGIQVELADAQTALSAWNLNIGFFSRVLRARPWVRVKVAASLDGRTGLDNGISQWITGEAARIDGHAWRKRASAILTGVGTVLADDPRLDVRLVPAAWHPLRVVADSALRTPTAARLLTPPGRALIVTAVRESARAAELARSGAEVLALPGADGRVDLAALAAELGRRGVNEIHVESGPGLTTALLKCGLVDELLLYMAPRLLGGQRGMVGWEPLHRLQDSLDFEWAELAYVGRDMRARLHPAGLRFGPGTHRAQLSVGFTTALTPE